MMHKLTLSAAGLVLLASCADADPAERPNADRPEATTAGALETPAWFQVDHAGETVDIHLIAGETSGNNYWNFNGLYAGAGEIVVPVGYTVRVELENRDPNMPHSAGVGERESQWPATFSDVEPAFEGAVSSNPRSATESTLPGQREAFSFVASEAGKFAVICYVPAHAITGMWVPFTVTSDGEAGVRR